MRRYRVLDPVVHLRALESVLDDDGKKVLQFFVQRIFVVLYAKLFGLELEWTRAGLEKRLDECLQSLTTDGPQSVRLAKVFSEMIRTLDELSFGEISEGEDELFSKLLH